MEFEDALALLWGLKQPPTRGPKATLTPEIITVTAIGIADEQGLTSLTMQMVAERLSFTKMSLYRHVPGRAELVALMVDQAIGQAPDLDVVEGGWRTRLVAWADAMWHVYDRHPWLVGAVVGHRPLGPNELAWTDLAVGALDGTGLDGTERLDTVFTVAGHVRNTAQQRVSQRGTKDTEERDEFGRALGALLGEHRDRYPALAKAADDSTPTTRDNGLAFGLDRILDGVEGLVAQRR